MNKVVRTCKNHRLYTLQKCHTSSNENRRRRSRHEEIKCKEEKRTFLEKKNPDRYQLVKEGPKQNRSMVCRKMEKGQEKRERLARSKVWSEKKRVYIGNGRTETENNCKSH